MEFIMALVSMFVLCHALPDGDFLGHIDCYPSSFSCISNLITPAVAHCGYGYPAALFDRTTPDRFMGIQSTCNVSELRLKAS